MTLQEELQYKFETITGLSDFRVVTEEVCHPENYGEYFLKSHELKLYTKAEDGTIYPQSVLEREGLHELAHHLQYNHTKGYKKTLRTVHGHIFRKQFAKVLKKYYNGEVPLETTEYLRGEGYLK